MSILSVEFLNTTMILEWGGKYVGNTELAAETCQTYSDLGYRAYVTDGTARLSEIRSFVPDAQQIVMQMPVSRPLSFALPM